MRYDAGQKERTRVRLLRAAAESIRARGLAATTIDGVTAAAGITRGGFYAHFSSRDELVAAAIREMFVPGAAALGVIADPRATLAAYVDFYLSRAHRDRLATVCPVPILAAEAERLAEAPRRNFADGAARLTAMIRGQLEHVGRADPDEEAHSVLAELVGALELSRAEPDPERSEARLEHSRRAIRRRLSLGDAGAADAGSSS